MGQVSQKNGKKIFFLVADSKVCQEKRVKTMVSRGLFLIKKTSNGASASRLDAATFLL